MAKSMTIRDVSDETHNKLASRAALKGMSLQEYMKAKLDEMANQMEPAEWVEMVRRRKATMQSSVTTEQILAWKNMDRP
jgi:plasmid stability protein